VLAKRVVIAQVTRDSDDGPQSARIPPEDR
jgi:hypothetical protein